MKKVTANSILNYLVQSGMIDLPVLEQTIQMKNMEELLARKHKVPITLGKDGRWRTRIRKDGNSRMIAKKKKEDLLKELYSYYFGDDAEDALTFENAFDIYKAYKKMVVSDNTFDKYETDYIRFFKGTDFEGQPISAITPEDCEAFIVNRIRDLKVLKKAFASLWDYMNGTFRYARNKRYISENPMDFLIKKDFFKYCTEKNTKPSDRIISEEEYALISQKIKENHRDKPNFMTVYAVELANLTGMRAGELGALMWECVDFNNKVIIIDKAEVFHQRAKTFTIEKTKNGKVRYIPMTEEMEKLLRTIYEIEKEYGYLCEFVFANENGHIHKNAIGTCAKNKSKQVGLKSKPLHSYRRTINSRMRANGVSREIAASILGHSPEVNDNNYTYDISGMDRKREILKQAEMSV